MKWLFWRILPIFVAFIATTVAAKEILPGEVRVVNGDTIVAKGQTYRLVGFDAPDTAKAKCPSERKLGYRAAFRLRQIIAGGGLDLEPVKCDGGGSCAILRAHGQDVAEHMIAQGLARQYACSAATCPPQKSWCSRAKHG
jgi:endonuclease YncB( thermonuclease family)